MTELRSTYERRSEQRPAGPVSTRNQVRNQNTGNRKRHSPAGMIILLVLLMLAAVAGFLLYRKFGPGTAWADYTELYGAGADETVVFCNGIQTEESICRNPWQPELTANGITVMKDCFYIL